MHIVLQARWVDSSVLSSGALIIAVIKISPRPASFISCAIVHIFLNKFNVCFNDILSSISFNFLSSFRCWLYDQFRRNHRYTYFILFAFRAYSFSIAVPLAAFIFNFFKYLKRFFSAIWSESSWVEAISTNSLFFSIPTEVNCHSLNSKTYC